jgi:glutamate-1-semialdehyde aminotransferase
MSEQGVFLSPSSHETGFTYLAHSDINLADYHNPFAPLV